MIMFILYGFVVFVIVCLIVERRRANAERKRIEDAEWFNHISMFAHSEKRREWNKQ